MYWMSGQPSTGGRVLQKPTAGDLQHAPAREQGAWPHFAEDEIAAVVDVLRSGRVNQWGGTHVEAFEAAMARYHGVQHSVAVANGTLALDVALRAFEIGPGDEVIVTARSFIASASCVSLLGAVPVFADVDPQSQNITPETVAPLITSRTRAIIPVHLAGWPCDMPGLMALAKQHGLVVVEDCAQAIGARIGGQLVGTFGDAATFSFCQDKIISTGGEGGMIFFRDKQAWQRGWSFKDHGKDYAKARQETSNGKFRWVHDSLGTNARLTEMQAAIGLVQLGKLNGWLAQRKANAEIWHRALSPLANVRVPMPGSDIVHANYKFYAFVVPERLRPGVDRDGLLDSLKAEGLIVRSGSCPEIYLEEAYADATVERLPMARMLGETSMMFEIHPTLDQSELTERAVATARVLADHVAE